MSLLLSFQTFHFLALGKSIPEGDLHSHNKWCRTQNEDLKYSFLASHRDKSLSGLLSILITDFLPGKHARYGYLVKKQE